MQLSFFLMGALSLIACGEKSKQHKEVVKSTRGQKSIPIQIQKIDTTTFITERKYYGSVRGVQEATLYTYGGGTVLALDAKEGKRVRKKEKLCDIDGEAFHSFAQSAKIAQDIAFREWKSSQKLYVQKNISKKRLEESRQVYLQAKYQFLTANKNSQGAYCVSPINGIITRHYIQLHQYLAPRSKTIEIAQMDTIRIDLDVPEEDIQKYSVGGIAKVFVPKSMSKEIDSKGKSQYVQGQIQSISQKVDSKNQKYRVIVHAPNQLKKRNFSLQPFHSGQTVSIWLKQEPLSGTIAIPTELLQSSQGIFFVLIATTDKEGQLIASKRVVEVGPQDGSKTAILNGLSKGDSLITQGHTLVIQGTPVYIPEN